MRALSFAFDGGTAMVRAYLSISLSIVIFFSVGFCWACDSVTRTHLL